MTSLALIGPGRHGTAIATLFASHGADVVLYHHRLQKAEIAARTVRARANGAEVTVAPSLADAVAGQELVVLATLWDSAQRAVIAELGELLAGKILLDVSNPLDVTAAGIVPRTPVEGSAGQFVATLLPANTAQAKAFSNLATAFIGESADLTPPAVLPFAADSAETAERIRPYLERTGWLPWLVGDISVSRELEIGGRYNRVHGRWGRSRLDETEMHTRFGPQVLLPETTSTR
ncbi:NADP oxidoreductase [Gordonia sp. HNM0687]|uniref:NADP oxidoreductase n=1 Tax=Gordonia mangrovi TaxID=2665643 RepID=A0A6L7GNW7_9ACTN|nr:NAD(P)-binding domain-containing protein [Gordonia mangrovi]MXP21302.1 NADP oxidoreductase [Gordonia mangrovi]UVF80053.1 NAD(P)-binding domain-containing protein [Gordonia mangrovi]